MNHRCLNEHEIAEVREFPAGHPRRLEIEACPRCRGLLLDYQEFVSPSVPPPQARLAEARSRLAQSLQEKAQSEMETRPPAPAVRAHRPAWDWALRRPGLAMAAGLLLVAAVYFGVRSWNAPGLEPDLLRTAPAPGPSSSTIDAIAVHVQPGADGSVVLTWRGVAGADAYQVRLIAPDLSESMPWAPGPDTSFVVTPARLPAEIDRSAGLACRVLALREGDVIASSPARLIGFSPPPAR